MKQYAMWGAERIEGFEDWWSAYPNKVGKGAARTAYLRALRKADAATLADGVRQYVAAKPADRPYCNPATWLNQERWLDQPAGPAAAYRNGLASEHRLENCAKLIAQGVNVAGVTRADLAIMVVRGWLSDEQARRAGL